MTSQGPPRQKPRRDGRRNAEWLEEASDTNRRETAVAVISVIQVGAVIGLLVLSHMTGMGWFDDSEEPSWWFEVGDEVSEGSATVACPRCGEVLTSGVYKASVTVRIYNNLGHDWTVDTGRWDVLISHGMYGRGMGESTDYVSPAHACSTASVLQPGELCEVHLLVYSPYDGWVDGVKWTAANHHVHSHIKWRRRRWV